MITFTIEQAKGMAGKQIARIEATVVSVYDRKTGEGQYGPWSIQSGLIRDDTGEMKIVFKQFPDRSKLVGKKLVFKSMEGRNGLKGIEVKNNDYKGKITPELHVTKTALIIGAEEEPYVSQVEPSTRIPQNEPERPIEAVNPALLHEDRKLGLATAKNRLTQLAGLYDMCWKTVRGMDLKEEDLSSEEFKDIATTLFIQASREGLADKMPIRTLSKFYNEEAIVPSSEKYRGEPAGEEEMAKTDIPF
jgi:hypothetical protein